MTPGRVLRGRGKGNAAGDAAQGQGNGVADEGRGGRVGERGAGIDLNEFGIKAEKRGIGGRVNHCAAAGVDIAGERVGLPFGVLGRGEGAEGGPGFGDAGRVGRSARAWRVYETSGCS